MDTIDTSDTSQRNLASPNRSCCGSMEGPNGSAPSTTSVAPPPGQGVLNVLRPWLSDRRVLILAAVALAVGGIALGWNWVVALGLAPLILAFAPCAIMCALGLCMMGKGKGGQASGASGKSSPDVATAVEKTD